MQLRPRNALYNDNWRKVLQSQAKYSEAIIYAQEAHRLLPDSVEYIEALRDARLAERAYMTTQRGCMLYNEKKYVEAEAEYRLALQTGYGDFASAHSNMAATLYRQKKFKEAIPFYEKAISLDAKDTNFPKALQLCRDGIKQEKFDKDLKEAIRKVEWAEPQSALYALNECFKAQPYNSLVAKTLGNAHEMLGRFRDATFYYQRALDWGAGDSIQKNLRECEARATPLELGYTLQDRLAKASSFDTFQWSERRKAKPLLKSLIADLGTPPAGSEKTRIYAAALLELSLLYYRASERRKSQATMYDAMHSSATPHQRHKINWLIASYWVPSPVLVE